MRKAVRKKSREGVSFAKSYLAWYAVRLPDLLPLGLGRTRKDKQLQQKSSQRSTLAGKRIRTTTATTNPGYERVPDIKGCRRKADAQMDQFERQERRQKKKREQIVLIY